MCETAHLQHRLLVLTVLHLSRGEIENSPLHAVSLCVIDVDIWPPHHHKALHPSVGVRLQEVDVTLLRHDGAERHRSDITTCETKRLYSQHTAVTFFCC